MRIIFMGTPDFAVAALEKLCAAHEVVAVYTQPPRPAGRGQQERLSPVHAFAGKKGIPVRTPVSLKSSQTQAEFASWNAEIAVVAAYGLILPQAILEAPPRGCLNIHASLLPRWRGAAPIQRAIMAGDKVSGVTIMQMDAGLDTGAVLLKREVPINITTTAGELHDVLAECGAQLILEELDGLDANKLTPEPQPEAGVTYAKKIEKAEAHIDFNRSAADVLRHIHGLSPAPGAWFTHGRERIKILQAEASSLSGSPGEVLGDNLEIGCANSANRAVVVQRAGKSPADAEAFLRGYALPKGSRLA